MHGFAYKNYLNAVYPLLCAEFPFPLLEFPSLYFFFNLITSFKWILQN